MGAWKVHAKVCSAIALLLLFVPVASSWGQDSNLDVRPRVELSLKSWLFTAGETQWSHDASGLDPALGDPTSTLKYKDNDTHLVGLGAKVHLTRRLFLDGEFGFSVDFDRGSLIDDDYFAGQRLFSRTSSDITGKGTWYINGHVGFRAVDFRNGRGHLDVLGGLQYWRTTYEATGIDRMKPIDVLRRIDCFDDRRLINLARQRQLRENAVDVVARVQGGDQVKQS